MRAVRFLYEIKSIFAAFNNIKKKQVYTYI